MTKGLDKYALYRESVQSPEEDVIFFRRAFRELCGREAVTMREDFCGTFSLSCAWVQADAKHRAIGVDLDSEPLSYGRDHYLRALSPEAQHRITLLQQDVLQTPQPAADLILACNFSFYCFKQRPLLLRYLKACHQSLAPGGMMALDCFGGPNCHEANEEETEHDDFSYFWDQDSYNPITNEAKFYIHFQQKGEKKQENCFTYDWRMWSIAELRDLLAEAGFSRSVVYWEGNNEDGEGNGDFQISETGDDCETWLAYIAAVK